jgi:hypothetical protein
MKVLLGEVPAYQSTSPTPGLPSLPVEHKHPYHIIVVAGQECPTPSGVPRGVGGLMKGVSVRRDEGHRKEKEEQRERKGSLAPSMAPSEDEDRTSRDASLVPGSPMPTADEQDSEDSEHELARPRPPSPVTPHHHLHRHAQTSKGWSAILDGKLEVCRAHHRLVLWTLDQSRAVPECLFPFPNRLFVTCGLPTQRRLGEPQTAFPYTLLLGSHPSIRAARDTRVKSAPWRSLSCPTREVSTEQISVLAEHTIGGRRSRARGPGVPVARVVF